MFLARMQVEDEAMAVASDRREGEDLRLDHRLQLDHDAYHAGAVLPRTDAADVGVAVEHLGRQRLQHAVEFDAFQVDHEAIRVLHQHMAEAQVR